MTTGAFTTASADPLVTVKAAPRPQLAIVYVTYGTGDVIIGSLRSLVASLDGGELPYDVTVVDNAHPTRPHRTLRRLLLDTAGVRVVESATNRGFGGGCNEGVRRTESEFLAFVNPDVEFRPGWLGPLLAALDGGAAIAAPVLLEPDGTVQSAGHRLFADGSTEPVTEPGSIRADYASAACWLLRRDTFDRIGPFDEGYHPAYYEDVDLALRARRAGGTAVVPTSTILHHHGASTDDRGVPDTTPQRLRLVRTWTNLLSEQPAPD